ncbi:hypothetical protein [Massilia sp. erpn]|uniref:hypothetical protein n=1 Tax=Massilia sp. erpn TaxID=2738142 RepID=UPI002105D0CC|nr:hypothetical protein [Massilia sp. erpn]UTY59921.1 hypothetical protein HPQ68_23670 [Massilia sp. erpn]
MEQIKKATDKNIEQAERILGRQMAVELSLEEIEEVAGGMRPHCTCSNGVPDACDA